MEQIQSPNAAVFQDLLFGVPSGRSVTGPDLGVWASCHPHEGDGKKRKRKLRWVRPHVGLRLSACFRARCGLQWRGSLGAVFV